MKLLNDIRRPSAPLLYQLQVVGKEFKGIKTVRLDLRWGRISNTFFQMRIQDRIQNQ